MKWLLVIPLTIALTQPAYGADTGGASQPAAPAKPVATPTASPSQAPSPTQLLR